MKMHFIGIGGEGMCGAAKLALTQGHTISGSEIVYKRQITELEQLGAIIYPVHRTENISNVDFVVHSSGIPATHIEIVTAHCLSIPVIKRARALGMLLSNAKGSIVAVAGSHGKSTTTTMIGRILENANNDPTVIVGAYVPYFNSHARIGRGDTFVVEACEFDRSFLEIASDIGVITSIKLDHLDYYQLGLSEIIEAFHQFSELNRQRNGLIIACTDDESVREKLLPSYRGKVITYGLNTGDWQAQPLSVNSSPYSFLVSKEGNYFGEFAINIPGRHNIQNALAAIAVTDALGINKDFMRLGLRKYSGIHRRYEKRYVSNSVVVIDDYAHSPTEIEAVLSATRQEFPEAYIICVICLRQFHRTHKRLTEFVNAFRGADNYAVGPIVSGLGDTEATKNLITSEMVASAISDIGYVAVGSSNENVIVDYILNIITDKGGGRQCVLLAVGSGVTENIISAVCKLLPIQ